MLVLHRRPGERLFVGDDVIIEVVGVRKGNQVILGILAPAEISVDREEIRREKDASKARARAMTALVVEFVEVVEVVETLAPLNAADTPHPRVPGSVALPYLPKPDRAAAILALKQSGRSDIQIAISLDCSLEDVERVGLGQRL